MKSKRIKSNEGMTLIDAIIAVIALVIFTGVIAALMYRNYRMALQIQATSNANAYATIIMEKVDQKSFNDIDNNFVQTLINNQEIQIDSRYSVSFSVSNATTNPNYYKECNVTITYGQDLFGSPVQFSIKKYKLKERGLLE